MWIVHQVSLHDIQSRRHTGHQTLLFQLICLIYLNFASAAAPLQEVAVPDGTPDLFVLWIIYSILFEWCIRCRTTTRNQGTRRGARLLVLIHFDLSYFCIRCRSTTRSRGARRGTRLFSFLFELIHFDYLSCASGAAPQQAAAALDRAPDFYLFFQIIIWIVHQLPLHNKESWHQAGNQTVLFFFILIYFDNLFELCSSWRSTTISRSTRKGTRFLFFEWCIRCRSTTKRQGAAAPNGAPDLLFIISLF